VTGIDFSPRSIAHARAAAQQEGLGVRYETADYLSWTPDERFDLALMIFCDYGAMAPRQRRQLLERMRDVLEPGGAFLFDVSSLAALASLEETAAYAPRLMDGFWSPHEYFGFLNTFTYPDERASVDRYEIVEADRTRTFCNWVQYYDPASLAAELAGSGMIVAELVGDVAGAPYDASAHEFAVVARPIAGR
jgi:SAM-dependent methyltransferase